jgi:hypothetical protein
MLRYGHIHDPSPAAERSRSAPHLEPHGQ